MEVGFMLSTMVSVEMNEAALAAAEAFGMDSVWVPDHLLGPFHPRLWSQMPASAAVADPNSWLDPFCLAAILGRHTDLTIGTCVTDATRRRAADLTRTALTLQQSGRGGFILGIGAGEAESLVPFGYEFSRPTGLLEDALRGIRSLLDTGTMPDDLLGRTGLSRDTAGDILQMWVAGNGPRSLRLTGTYADGWLPVGVTSPAEYAAKRAVVRAAAEAAGRREPESSLFPLVVLGRSRDNVAELFERNPLTKMVLLFAPAAMWEKYGLQHPNGPGTAGYHDTIPHALDPEATRLALAAAPREMIEEFVFTGNAAEIAEQIAPYRAEGLEHVILADLTGVTHDPDAAAELMPQNSCLSMRPCAPCSNTTTPPTSCRRSARDRRRLIDLPGRSRRTVHAVHDDRRSQVNGARGRVDQIRRLVANQPDVSGDVEITIISTASVLGASNGCVVFDAEWGADGGRVRRELILRHAPGTEERLFADYDLPRQFRVQAALQGSSAPVPEPCWLDADGRWLGLPGYAMARVKGIAPSAAAFVHGPIADASPADRERMIAAIMAALVAIHQTDLRATGLQDFVMDAGGAAAFQKLINWYWKSWERLRPPQYERLLAARDWLLANVPSGEPELIHGDANLHDYLFDGSRLVAVLDWEMSTLARAEADLAMQCLANETFAPPPESGFAVPPTEQEWLTKYREAGGRVLRDFEYFKTYAAFVLIFGVVLLQRNLPAQQRAGQERLLKPCWRLVDACR